MKTDAGSDNEDGLDLSALCDEAGVTPRTVYYYTQQGLLPSPGSGRGTRYSEGHRLRLAWIRHRQRAHLPLAAIRQELDRLSDADLASLLLHEGASPGGASGAGSHPPVVREADGPASALDYIENLLGGRVTRRPPSVRHSRSIPAAAGLPSGVRGTQPAAEAQPAATPERSTWERHRLGDDVELHVRRPLDRFTNRKVERLLELARQLLAED